MLPRPQSKNDVSAAVRFLGRCIPNTDKRIWCCMPRYSRGREAAAVNFGSVGGGDNGSACFAVVFLVVWFGMFWAYLPDCALKDVAAFFFFVSIVALAIFFSEYNCSGTRF